MAERVEVIRRADGKDGWRKVAVNEEITSTDGGQGYSRLIEAVRMAKQENPGVPVLEVHAEQSDA